MNAPHVLGESTSGAPSYSGAGAYIGFKVVATHAVPVAMGAGDLSYHAGISLQRSWHARLAVDYRTSAGASVVGGADRWL
jgi:hypothetical protein